MYMYTYTYIMYTHRIHIHIHIPLMPKRLPVESHHLGLGPWPPRPKRRRNGVPLACSAWPCNWSGVGTATIEVEENHGKTMGKWWF